MGAACQRTERGQRFPDTRLFSGHHGFDQLQDDAAVKSETKDQRWVRPAFIALLAGTAALYLWNLSASGYANTFYAAAAQAGSQSWEAFLFGSADAGNTSGRQRPHQASGADRRPCRARVPDQGRRRDAGGSGDCGWRSPEVGPWSCCRRQAAEPVNPRRDHPGECGRAIGRTRRRSAATIGRRCTPDSANQGQGSNPAPVQMKAAAAARAVGSPATARCCAAASASAGDRPAISPR
jgi:hypothetical protein